MLIFISEIYIKTKNLNILDIQSLLNAYILGYSPGTSVQDTLTHLFEFARSASTAMREIIQIPLIF